MTQVIFIILLLYDTIQKGKKKTNTGWTETNFVNSNWDKYLKMHLALEGLVEKL